MLTLLEKIQADAAKRFPLPAGRQPAQELARFKNFLKSASQRLKWHHRNGAGGREVCQARAQVLDLLLRHLLEAVRQNLPLIPSPYPFAFVAIGGYGRGELNPFSDIDILFLHGNRAEGASWQHLKALVEKVLLILYDVGLKVGHSVRTIADCVQQANRDMQSKTALIEARLIVGEEEFFRKMQKSILDKCVKGHESEYIAARLADQEARRAKFGNSSSRQEPNLKNGCGGLRDVQNLLWMAFFKHQVQSLEALEKLGTLNARESRQLEQAYDFLLRVRNELHYHAGRPAEVLTRSVQPAVAYALGYHDRSPVKRLELFMRDFYTHARHVHLLTQTIEQRLALVPPRRLPFFNLLRAGRAKDLEAVDGFRFTDGTIQAASSVVFQEEPRRLMRVFLHAQQRGLELHPELMQILRHQIALVDKAFLRDPHVHQTFLEILNQRGNVARVLRQMHEVGFLGKYLPEFGELTCLVQHEFYHQYTADEHTLVCLEKLDQIWGAQTPPFSHYTEVFQKLERPFVLYLALLLHDAGKAQPTEDHADLGGKLALRVARRLGLDHAATEALRLIIENHLLLASTSQRHDLDDPSVIRSFANQIRTPEHLALLTLHTFADSMGTSDQLWNDFKETLLWTLHQKTRELLTAGTDFLREEVKHREMLAREVQAAVPAGIGEDELQAHFENLPPRYFHVHSPRDVVHDLTLAHHFFQLQVASEDHGLAPVISWHDEPDRGYTAVKVCTWNRTGLFSKIAGALTAAGLNILSAQIFSRRDAIILDTFFVNDAMTLKLPDGENRRKFELLLTTALTDHIDLRPLLASHRPRRLIYFMLEGGRIPTLIHCDNSISDSRTVIDVETEDRVGLLYVLSHALAGLGLDISLAKITTEKGAALDTFYVTEQDGRKILSRERFYEIEHTLYAAVATLDRAGNVSASIL